MPMRSVGRVSFPELDTVGAPRDQFHVSLVLTAFPLTADDVYFRGYIGARRRWTQFRTCNSLPLVSGPVWVLAVVFGESFLTAAEGRVELVVDLQSKTKNQSGQSQRKEVLRCPGSGSSISDSPIDQLNSGLL